MSQALIYAGTCPVCEGGLCRVRICGVASNHLHGLILCDECEAAWSDPDTKQARLKLDIENPVSPVTGESLWDESNRWATLEDICLLGWHDRLIIEPMEDAIAGSDVAYGHDEPKPGC